MDFKSKNSKKRRGNSIDLKNKSQAFKDIYENYKNSLKSRKFEVNLMTALAEYRKEKLTFLTNDDIIKEEIGEEVKRYSKALTYYSKYAIKKTVEPKQKEKDGKLGVLTLFRKFNNEGKFDPPGAKVKPFKRGPLKRNIVEDHPIFGKTPAYVHTEPNLRKRESLLPPLNGTKVPNCTAPPTKRLHKKSQKQIEEIADGIEKDSRNIRKGFCNTLSNFQTKYERWKKVKTYLIPEIKEDEQKDEN